MKCKATGESCHIRNRESGYRGHWQCHSMTVLTTALRLALRRYSSAKLPVQDGRTRFRWPVCVASWHGALSIALAESCLTAAKPLVTLRSSYSRIPRRLCAPDLTTHVPMHRKEPIYMSWVGSMLIRGLEWETRHRCWHAVPTATQSWGCWLAQPTRYSMGLDAGLLPLKSAGLNVSCPQLVQLQPQLKGRHHAECARSLLTFVCAQQDRSAIFSV